MRKLICVLAAVAIWSPTLCGQGVTTPQTARQALLEMFISKTQEGIAKHLPAATLAALEKSGAITSLEQYSLFANQFHIQGNKVQVFETGSVLLSGEDPKSGRKL